jgi:hypothetical protein
MTAGPVSGTVPADVGGVPGFRSFTGLPGIASSSVDVPSGDFGSYETVGGLPPDFIASLPAGTYTGSSVAGVAFGGSADVGGTVTVTHTYHTRVAMPEPASLGALGLALLGLGVIRSYLC